MFEKALYVGGGVVVLFLLCCVVQGVRKRRKLAEYDDMEEEGKGYTATAQPQTHTSPLSLRT
jgi:hypothetical protein